MTRNLGLLFLGCTLTGSVLAAKKAPQRQIQGEYVYSNSYYYTGERRGADLIHCYILLAKGELKKSAQRKEATFKKHGATLSEIRDNLSLGWLYQSGIYKSNNPLKTEEQKQAFIDARNYFKGIGQKLKSFNFERYLKKHKVSKNRTKELLNGYNFMATSSLELAGIDDFDTAFEKLKEIDKEVTKISKTLWS